MVGERSLRCICSFSRWARSMDSSLVSLPNSTSSQPPPCGRRATSFTDDLFEFPLACLANVHALAIVGEDVECFEVVTGHPCHHGVGAAGVVADHAAQGALRVCCWIRTEGEVRVLGCGTQGIKD